MVYVIARFYNLRGFGAAEYSAARLGQYIFSSTISAVSAESS